MKDEYLRRCQVATPMDVVQILWRLAVSARRVRAFESVLDLGAGDARFACSANAAFEHYLGIEIDANRNPCRPLPTNAQVIRADALQWRGDPCSLAIGNPPYVRHHHLDPTWREAVGERLLQESGVRLKRTANVYVLFLLQALLRTRADGLVVQLVPFEWVTRPSASELREFIRQRGWNVQVYRFDADIFPTVLTTASIVLIDKGKRNHQWRYGVIGRDGSTRAIASPTGSDEPVLPYAAAPDRVRALRGLSPGGQDIFVLTEEQRLCFALKKTRDVVPCVTTLRRVDPAATQLNAGIFNKRYVNAGEPCWLIRSDRATRSPQLQRYLQSVGTRWARYSTCTARRDWSRFTPHPPPALLVSSGFVREAPKVLVNDVMAVAVGSVYAVISSLTAAQTRRLASGLRAYDFSSRVVHHSNNLRKIAVRQLNAALQLLMN